MPDPIAHRNVALLQVSDPAVLDEIAAVVPLEGYVLGRISATELVIDPARLGELTSRLSEHGLPPLVKKARLPVQPETWTDAEDTAPVGRRRRR